MYRADLHPPAARVFAAAVFAAATLAAGGARAADRPTQPLRYEAPIRVERAAPFVALTVPTGVYARSEQGLADLRVVDADGGRVPFTLLEPRRAVETREASTEAALFALPAKPAGNGAWPSPVDVVVEGDRITVHRRGATTARSADASPPGWLIDTGERRSDAAPVRRLRLRWALPAEFTAGYRIETSDDLRGWRGAAVGQLIALAGAGGAPLAQPLVELPDGAGRFVRLVWLDAANAPRLTGAAAIAPERRSVDVDPPVEVRADATVDPREPRALVFDLGGALPVDDVALRFAAGNRIAPALVQGRRSASQPWRDLGATVFNRFERDGVPAGVSPPFPLGVGAAAIRYVRIAVDERAAAVKPGEASLVARLHPDLLVFASEGKAPWRLLVGSVDAPAGALPPATLVPRIDEERARFGAATLGELREIPAAARAVERDAQAARIRPLVLWAVLLVGVAILGAMVWRLARAGAQAPPASGA